MSARIFVPRESTPGEKRVAATPETVKRYLKAGVTVGVETGAGAGAYISDEAFRDAGAEIVADARQGWTNADIVLKVAPPTRHAQLGDEAVLLKDGAVLVCHVWAYKNLPLVKTLAARKISCLALELVPRISRAQTMDVLSSQANVAGYKAVLLAAARLPKYFPLLMTAAGTIQPARVVIMGAGVAGLQAIATARRLGALVEVSDVRPEVKEQVESLGAKFIDLPMQESGAGEGGYAKEMSADFLRKQQEIVAARVVASDCVITTAQIPGRPAPRLITAETVKNMRPGSVIVDLAAESGGNCELTEAGKEIEKHGVTILGFSDLPSSMATDASQLFARNVAALLGPFLKEGQVQLDLEDDVVKGALLTHQGEVRHEPTAKALAQGGAA